MTLSRGRRYLGEEVSELPEVNIEEDVDGVNGKVCGYWVLANEGV